MGILAPGSAHAGPSAQPPIDTSGNFSTQVSGRGAAKYFPLFVFSEKKNPLQNRPPGSTNFCLFPDSACKPFGPIVLVIVCYIVQRCQCNKRACEACFEYEFLNCVERCDSDSDYVQTVKILLLELLNCYNNIFSPKSPNRSYLLL